MVALMLQLGLLHEDVLPSAPLSSPPRILNMWTMSFLGRTNGFLSCCWRNLKKMNQDQNKKKSASEVFQSAMKC